MDDAFFMMFTEAPSGRVIAILSVVDDDPPARKRLVITGPGGVYDLHLDTKQTDQLAAALKK